MCYGYDKYFGINGVVVNPASIAGSKYKVNLNIISAGALTRTNAYELVEMAGKIDRDQEFWFGMEVWTEWW